MNRVSKQLEHDKTNKHFYSSKKKRSRTFMLRPFRHGHLCSEMFMRRTFRHREGQLQWPLSANGEGIN